MTSKTPVPPIVVAAERLLVTVENYVRRFVRDFRYGIGEKLRHQAMKAYAIAWRAWRAGRNQPKQLKWVNKLRRKADTLVQHIQVAKLLKATRSFAHFEELIHLAENLGNQAGGWRKDLMRSIAQSAASLEKPESQRGEKLSAGAASRCGANR